MTNLTVITVATHIDGYMEILKNQLNEKKINYNILAYGEKWGGWNWRCKQIINYLKHNHEPDDLIMIIDGYDVLMLGNENDIIDKYKKFNTDVLFGIHNSPIQDYSALVNTIFYPIIKKYFNTSTHYIKNGGSFMGTAKSLIKIYQRIIDYYNKTKIDDDQVALNNIYLDDIDYRNDVNSSIFLIWDVSSMYELIYTVFYKQYPNYLNTNIKLNKYGRLQFKNGNQPEIIHGIGHRDMSFIVHDSSDLVRTQKVYSQVDMDVSLNILRLISLLLCIIIVYLIYHTFPKKSKK